MRLGRGEVIAAFPAAVEPALGQLGRLAEGLRQGRVLCWR